MFRFFMRWFRSKVAQNAETYKLGLSAVYAIVAWHACMYVVYQSLKPRDLSNEETREERLRKLTSNKAEIHIINVKGLHTTSIDIIKPEVLPKENQGSENQESENQESEDWNPSLLDN